MDNQQGIKVLKGLQAVRVRPGMFLGDTGTKGLHHCVWEVVDNAVDEYMNGQGDKINITLDYDGETMTVEDFARGIPTEFHAEEGKSQLELALTVLHAGGKFEGDAVTGGLHGVGVSCVNAVSDKMTVKVYRNGKFGTDVGLFQQSYEKGVPVTEVVKIADNANRHGTTVTFHIDKEIFTNGVDFDEKVLLHRFKQMAFLNAGLQINFQNKKTGTKDSYKFDGGILDYVKDLTSTKEGHYPKTPFVCDTKRDKVFVQVALQYTEDDNETVLTFANNIYTLDGGTHLSGFKTALTRVVNSFARSQNMFKASDTNLSGDDIREGVTAVVSVKLPQPQFEGQTKAKLGTVEVDGIVQNAFGEALTEYFQKNPAVGKSVVERAQSSQRAREAAKKAAETVKRKDLLGRTGRLPGKLSDCQTTNTEESEIWIVEGDSAGGSAKGGRDARTQAVLPIRGKIINSEKNDIISTLKSEEIRNLIDALGTGITYPSQESFNINNLRYGKIILATDADDDGSHIITLLLAFLYKFMRPLIENGHVYLPQPPLYRIIDGKNNIYCNTDAELQSHLKSKPQLQSKVTRFKGLGEMNKKEFGDTTMNKANRKLIQMTIEDLGEAEQMLSVLMGKNVVARKAHIVNHSVKLKAERATN